MSDPGSEKKKKPKQRHRLLVKPEELGLTARIKKAMVQNDMGITQRISKAIDKTKDKNSDWYIPPGIWIVLTVLVFLVGLLGWGTLRSRAITLTLTYEGGKEAPFVLEGIPLSPFESEKKVDAPDRRRQVDYVRGDFYGSDLTPSDFYITQKGEKVPNKNLLAPGTYEVHVTKEGYVKKKLSMTIEPGKEIVSLELEPLVIKSNTLQLYLNDPLLEGTEIVPDDIIVSQTGKSIKNTQVRDGEYVVQVVRQGYHSKELRVRIQDGRVLDKITLDYKKRPVKFLLQDGLSKKGQEPTLDPKDYKVLREGIEIPMANNLLDPGHYDLVVERDGYVKKQIRLGVMPGESLNVHNIGLKPIPREIRVRPNYDITPTEINPDKAYLSELFGKNKEVIPITEGIKVAPGRYHITVEKAGYYAHKEEIFIPAGSQPFEATAHLISAEKILFLQISSDFDVDPTVTPDDLRVKMLIEKKGFVGIDWDQLETSLPPEKKKIGLKAFLETIPRRVIADLTSEITKLPITPDLITLAQILEGEIKGQREEVSPDKKLKPGRYQLNINKVGYQTVEKEVIIYPDVTDFVIQQELQAFRRKLVLNLDSDYAPDEPIKPERTLLNRGENISDGHPLKPGSYVLTLEKPGYHVIEQTINVVPANEAFPFKAQFRAKNRRILFEIRGGEGIEKIRPDRVTIGGNEIRQGDLIPPKQVYEIKIEKDGFETRTMNVKVEPAEEDYVLKAVLKPKMRPIIFSITAVYPPGEILVPDKALLGAEPIREGMEVKPNKYQLIVVKGGYKTLDEELEVAPSESPFRITREMFPRPRNMTLDIKYDVEPDDRDNLSQVAKVSRSGDNFETVLETGKELTPNDYRLEIQSNGFEKIDESWSLPASESPFLLSRTLISLPRLVNFQAKGDYPPDSELKGFKVTLSGQEVNTVGKIKPGKYALVIEKAGYQTLNSNVSIPAGTTEHIVMERLITKPRVVQYNITDSETGEVISPDVITLGDARVTGAADFKPGKKQLQIKTQGYVPLTEEMELPVGTGPYTIVRSLKPANRLVKYEIKGDYNNANLTPDELTLNGESYKDYGKLYVRPGDYDLVVYVPGYDRYQDRLNVAASRDDLVIKVNLASKKRRVVFKVSSDFPKGAQLTPDRVTFDGQEITEGQGIKPKSAGYKIVLNKTGYTEAILKEIIEPSENEWILKAQMEARHRRLLTEVDSDYRPGVYLEMDRMTIKGERVEKGDRIPPGDHAFSLEKAGYETASFTQVIDASVEDFTLRKTLTTKPRLVKVEVYSDIMGEEPIEAELITLGEVEITSEGEMFKPGGYELNIQHLGHGEVRRKVEIEPGVESVVLKETLVAAPRIFNPNLLYDVAPPLNLAPAVIRVRNLRDQQYLRVTKGDELKPGEYELTVEKEGYDSYRDKLIIYPGTAPYTKDINMVAKFVQILLKISHDIQPPKGHPLYNITFVDSTGIGRNVSNGNRIKPGEYFLEIAQDGYEFKTPRKRIYVAPGTKEHKIVEKLYAKSRSLSFDLRHDGILVKAHEILIDNQVVKVTDTFKPGTKYNFIVKLKKFKTASKNIVIPPGEGPYVVDVELVELKEYRLKIAKDFAKKNLYGLNYSLEVLADGERLEEHHINPGEGFTLLDYTIYAPKGLRNLGVACAFYTSQSIVRDTFEFRDLEKINPQRLIEHLGVLVRGTTPSQAVHQVDRLLKDNKDRTKLLELSRSDRERVANLLRDINLESQANQTLRKEVIKKLLE